MSREIKFRLRIGDKIVGYEEWSSTMGWLYCAIGKNRTPIQKPYLHHTDKDQFTGRSAKNGEVYENDIVKAGNKDEDTGIIVFEEGCWYLRVLEKYRHPAKVSRACLHLIIPSLEIIGNIFQNPELLEAK